MLEDLVDRPLGPYPFFVRAERTAEFVASTGDDADRWATAAPPGFAAAGLFAAASPFLAHEDVRREGSSMLHGEQAFHWRGPLLLGDDLEVTARLRRLRRRAGTTFVWLATRLEGQGSPVVEADSLFVLTDQVSPAEELSEPAPSERGVSDVPTLLSLPPVGESLPPLPKSASRLDLIRYAAATGDWNPIHWDHGAAVRAGLPGVICHGLLISAWALQCATRVSSRPDPIQEARVRFRSPLLPARQATVVGRVVHVDEGAATLELRVASAGIEHAAASVIIRA